MALGRFGGGTPCAIFRGEDGARSDVTDKRHTSIAVGDTYALRLCSYAAGR